MRAALPNLSPRPNVAIELLHPAVDRGDPVVDQSLELPRVLSLCARAQVLVLPPV